MKAILILIILTFILMMVNIMDANGTERRVSPPQKIEVLVGADKRGGLL